MSFEIMHFRGAQEILKEKNMKKEVQMTMEYLDEVLYGSNYRRELLRQALEESGWRENGDLTILDGRRYNYKGFRKRVAMDGSFASYEYIHDALFRLQVGFDKKKIDMGIVLVTAQRSEKSPLGSTKHLVEQEIELLHPTISLPVTIALFDLGKRGFYVDKAAKAETAKKQGAETDPISGGQDAQTETADEKVVFIKPKPEKQTGRKKRTRTKAEAPANPAKEEAA